MGIALLLLGGVVLILGVGVGFLLSMVCGR